ncbi:MAG: cysteine desulfurase [Muribaculaceae bacterium]|nr:cysteine desulfurase [Muribaculaceae bacterium]
MFDVESIRAQFPALGRELYGRPMVYFDNVATSQTPRSVVDAITAGYFGAKANVHRGVHTLSQEATALQEHARERVRQWINAESVSEIIFTRGTTEAINLVASSFCAGLSAGDEIILTVMEHHANIVPWQLQAKRLGLVIKVAGINADGSLNLDEFRSLFSPRTRLAAFCHVSNVLGTVNPVADMIAEAHSHGVPVLVDGAQAVAHLRPDVRALNADFYAFSLHKMYGPSGIGVLYGRRSLLEAMPPYQGGGEMIAHVSFDGTTFAELPYKFEAGTPDFVGIGALPSALDFMEETGVEAMAAHEHGLLDYCTRRMAEVSGVTIYGTAPGKSPVISFNLAGAHHYDVGMLLDKQGVEVRTGHHCAQPLMHALGIEGTVRLGFAAYNTIDEVDRFIAALQRTASML